MTFQYQETGGDDLLETLLSKNKKEAFKFFYKGLVILIALHSGPFKESVECSQFQYHVFINISLLDCFNLYPFLKILIKLCLW